MSEFISNAAAGLGGIIKAVSEILLGLIGLAILAEVAFGVTGIGFGGTSVAANLTGLLEAVAGGNGLIGLLALLIRLGIVRK